jgi:hypothetical protein
MPRLGDNARLLEQRHGTRELPYHLGRGRGGDEVGRGVDRHELDAAPPQQGMAGQLHRQVTRETAGLPDHHQLDAVAGRLGVDRHRLALPAFAFLVGADVGGRTGAIVGDGSGLLHEAIRGERWLCVVIS